MKYKITFTTKNTYEIYEVEADSREEAFEKASRIFYDRHGHFWDSYIIESDDTADTKPTTMTTDEVIAMLKEMQEEAAKCQGFVEGHVAKTWVIQKMLGKRIEKLGGTPCVIKDGKLYVE